MRLAVLLTSLFFISSAGADQSIAPALSYLNKMGNALKQLNYHGTLVYTHDGQVESIRLVHRHDKNGEAQRIVHLSGEAREVIKNNDVVTCYMPDSHSVLVGKRRFNTHLLARLTKNFQDFGDQYAFVVDGHGRIAGRTTTNIAIRPKDNFRYGYRFWIDDDSALLLKSDLLDANGKALEQLMFVDVTVGGHISPDMLKPAINGESYTWHNGRGKNQPADMNNPPWKIRNMPVGFAIEGRSKQKMPNSDKLVDHLVVSDGLASISVYIEQFDVANKNKGFIGASRMGAINVYGSFMDDHHVTVVGEAPQGTVKMIAESIAFH